MAILVFLFIIGALIFLAMLSPEILAEIVGFVFIGIPLIVFTLGCLAAVLAGILLLVFLVT